MQIALSDKSYAMMTVTSCILSGVRHQVSAVSAPPVTQVKAPDSGSALRNTKTSARN